MKAHFLLASIAAVFAGVLCAQEKSTAAQDLPPIPFILGGDEVLPVDEAAAKADIAAATQTQTATAPVASAETPKGASVAEEPVASVAAASETSAASVSSEAPVAGEGDLVDLENGTDLALTGDLAEEESLSTPVTTEADKSVTEPAAETVQPSAKAASEVAQAAVEAVAAATEALPAENAKELEVAATKVTSPALELSISATEAALPTVLTAPEVEPAPVAVSSIASSTPVVAEKTLSMGDLEESSTAVESPAKTVSASQAALNKIASTSGAMSLTPVPVAAPEVVAVVPASAPVAAPSVNVSAQPTKITDFGPSYSLVLPPVIVEGVDGSRHVKGLEHNVGNPEGLLPVVERVSPIIAEVGSEFPELHVNNIPLPDLLTYLGNYTPKTLIYALQKPMSVSIDLKAKSVNEVLTYLTAHYPVEVITSGNNLILRESLQVPAAPDVMAATTLEKGPAISADTMVPLPAQQGVKVLDVAVSAPTEPLTITGDKLATTQEAPTPIFPDVVASQPKPVEPQVVSAIAGQVIAAAALPLPVSQKADTLVAQTSTPTTPSEEPKPIVTEKVASTAPVAPAVVEPVAGFAVTAAPLSAATSAKPVASPVAVPDPTVGMVAQTPTSSEGVAASKEEAPWQDWQRKAELESLATERARILADQKRVERQTRNYNISRRMD